MPSRRAQRGAGPSVPLCRPMVNRAGRRSQACRAQAVLLRYIARCWAHARLDCMQPNVTAEIVAQTSRSHSFKRRPLVLCRDLQAMDERHGKGSHHLSSHHGANQDLRVNADQLTVGTTAASGKQDAVPSLRIRAVMLGDRINAAGLEIGTLVSSTPVAFRVHAGLAVTFRYGVVVLIGLLPSEEKVLIDSLKARVTGELSPVEEEMAQAQLCND